MASKKLAMPKPLPLPSQYLSRQAEIAAQFERVLSNHLDDFMAERVSKMHELKDIAAIMCIHPVHLSKIIRLETGHHACYHYEQRILVEAKRLLANPAFSISEVARRLDYDVSNFTKFFKRFAGQTPSAYRKLLVAGA